MTGLPPDQLEAVLSHELAHLRRFDSLINLRQRLIEAVLFFHPAVWYVSHRVSLERENSCDDLVMAHGCDRLTYADALLRTAEICTLGSGKPIPGSPTALAATGENPSEFKRRVLRVVGETRGTGLRLTRGGLAVFAATLICIFALPFVMQLCASGTPEEENHSSEDHASNTERLAGQMRELETSTGNRLEGQNSQCAIGADAVCQISKRGSGCCKVSWNPPMKLARR